MSPFIPASTTSVASSSPSNTPASNSNASIAKPNGSTKKTIAAVPFVQQFDEIDRKIMEFRLYNQKHPQRPVSFLNNTRHSHIQPHHHHHHHNNNNNHHNNTINSNGYHHNQQQQQQQQHHHQQQQPQQSFRLQQPLPQLQPQIQAEQLPRRSSSLSPQYMLQQQQSQQIQRQSLSVVPTPVNGGTAVFQPPMQAKNLSTTSSVSSASTNPNSEFIVSNGPTASANSSSSSSNPSSRGLSQSSTFDDLLSPTFNPFGVNNPMIAQGSGSTLPGSSVSFLSSTNNGSEFNFNSPLSGNLKFKTTPGSGTSSTGNGGNTGSNIWNTDMSVWG